MFKRFIFVSLVFWFVPSAQADVAVNSVSGTWQKGSALVIQGAGFGPHGDFHQDMDKLIRVFDDFNDGTLTTNPYMTWGVYNARASALAQDNPRTQSGQEGFYRRNRSGLGFLSLPGRKEQEYFASFYMRLSDGFNITADPLGTHQFKIFRLYSANNRINVYPTIGGDDGLFMAVEFVKPEVMRYQTQIDAVPDRPKGWHKMTLYFKKNSAPGAKNGKCQVWWDNKLVFDWSSQFKDPKNNPTYAPNYPVTGDFELNDADLAGEWALGDYFSSAGLNTWVDFDDVYINHTQARVEVGNAPTYAACTVLEPQIPTSWSGGRIGVNVNPGALGNGNLYVYVIDKSGNVNSAGFPLRGGRPPTDPPPPSRPQPNPPPPPPNRPRRPPPAPRDTEAPLLRISRPTADVYYDAQPGQTDVTLAGWSRDDGEVAEISFQINGDHGGYLSEFDEWETPRIPLKVGENLFTVTALDKAGNKTVKELRVIRPPDPPPEDDPLRPQVRFLRPSAGRFLVLSRRAASLSVMDAAGRLVYTAEQGSNDRIIWRCVDMRGDEVPSGAYVCKITSNTGKTIYHSVAVVK